MKLTINKIFIFFAIAISFFLYSCKKDRFDVEIPAYIHIPKIEFYTNSTQGTATSFFEFFTVYVNDNPVGIFKAPVTFPVIPKGNQKIDVRLNVKHLARDGYVLYPLLTTYTVNLNLQAEKIDTIRPEITYRDNVKFAFFEDFEDSSINFKVLKGGFDTAIRTNFPLQPFDSSYYWHLNMGTLEAFFELESIDAMFLPRDNRDVFLEFEYASNVPFEVGLWTITPSLVTAVPSVLPFETGGEWRKAYVLLTEDIFASQQGATFKVLLRSFSNTVPNPYIKLDNFKLVHLE